MGLRGKDWALVRICLSVSLAHLIACSDRIPTQGDGDEIVFPDSGVSYSRHIEPLFQKRCALSGCHFGTNAPRGLDLSPPSYDKLRGHQPALVIAGEGNESYLIKKLDGRVPPRMPSNMQALNDDQINGIKKWINEGAFNN